MGKLEVEMIEIYSRIKPELLLHCVHRFGEFNELRKDLISAYHFIQCSSLFMEKDHTFRPHKHIWKHYNGDTIAQESWVVVSGSVLVTYYDIDDSILCQIKIFQGDASFTLAGGHTYTILEDNTKVYEMKTGPYTGQINDKVFINDN